MDGWINHGRSDRATASEPGARACVRRVRAGAGAAVRADRDVRVAVLVGPRKGQPESWGYQCMWCRAKGGTVRVLRPGAGDASGRDARASYAA